MHILLTNDDGPPNPQASPYVTTFIRILTSPPFSHTVSVVLPTTQRSWIGKAHLLPPSHFPGDEKTRNKNEDVTDVIKPRYYDPASEEIFDSLAQLRLARSDNQKINTNNDGTLLDGTIENDPRERKAWPDYWVLVPGTPSMCVQLGLFHHDLLFPDFTDGTNTPNTNASHSPIDLVLSGPNYGRNTTAAFALSSGTIGGAMEGAVCGIRAIALSFAFFTRQETDDMIAAASTLGVRIVEKLTSDWSGTNTVSPSHSSPIPAQPNNPHENPSTLPTAPPDLYSINIPLVEDLASRPIRYTWMLDNKWSTGSLYKNIEPSRAEIPSNTGPGDASNGSNLNSAFPSSANLARDNDLGARSGIATVDGTPSSRFTSADVASRLLNRSSEAAGDAESLDTTSVPAQAPMFRWSPQFKDIWTTVEESGRGNDGLVIRERGTSVTPLRANYCCLWGVGGRWVGDVQL